MNTASPSNDPPMYGALQIQVVHSKLTLKELIHDGWMGNNCGEVDHPDSMRTGVLDTARAATEGHPRAIWEKAIGLGLRDEPIYKPLGLGLFVPYLVNYMMVHTGQRYRPYETEELRYVFRVHVVNDETHDFVGDLYTKFDYYWPNMQARNWERGSHEYHDLLDTPNVRGVVTLVLGEFARGTRRRNAGRG
ncbi:hypothetical protein N7532_010954 [Penicillium argentinense]|uniref:Uncharacterized protein n=1 Tax=Penicillium argentinense TaxID=1131581 RepID=A0A9W9EQJ2_9EURO|nr:uncharacterized protein N7532_010954 [Penicillium argentinense]KAJ5086183.1 hypothetical protein N7532_010954 [Penicillium argentinense]